MSPSSPSMTERDYGRGANGRREKGRRATRRGETRRRGEEGRTGREGAMGESANDQRTRHVTVSLLTPSPHPSSPRSPSPRQFVSRLRVADSSLRQFAY